MQLFFEIIEGDRTGHRFEVRPGLTIGRSKADIVLNDSKVSSRHAKIEERENGSLFLVDLDSSNGIRIGKERAKEVLLVPQVVVRIGKTILKVVDLEGEGPVLEAPAIETWNETLDRLAFNAKDRFKEGLREMAAFNPLVQLKFLQGGQAGVLWTLGYGPRQAGFNTLDLRIKEPDSPDVCFELIPHRDGPQFKTDHPDKVRLNGTAIRESRVSSGDVIDIAKTKIEIVFKYDE